MLLAAFGQQGQPANRQVKEKCNFFDFMTSIRELRESRSSANSKDSTDQQKKHNNSTPGKIESEGLPRNQISSEDEEQTGTQSDQLMSGAMQPMPAGES